MKWLLLLALAWSAPAVRGAERPHIVYLLADDLGWNDVGYLGSEIRTPHLDRLAAEGVRLERFYVQPLCTPTRAALFTGKHPARLGLQSGVIMPWSDYGLPAGTPLLSETLRRAGYRTALLGKWHLGHARPEMLPEARGFDHFYGLYWGRIDYWTHHVDEPRPAPGLGLDWHRNGAPLRESGYSTDLLAAEAIRIIHEQPEGRPLFLVVAFNAPHDPLQAPDEEVARYAEIPDPRRRVYAAMVTRMDRAIGAIIAALESRGLSERTLVVFSSDNGADPKFGGSNHPLRSGKFSPFEGGIRVPAIARWKGRLKPGRVESPLLVMDWLPTFHALAGIPAEPNLDGQNILPVLEGKEPATSREFLIHVEANWAAIRSGDWKLVVFGPWRDAARRKYALHDLSADPAEERDLSSERPEQVERLLKRLEALAGDLPAPLRTPRPASYDFPAVIGARE